MGQSSRYRYLGQGNDGCDVFYDMVEREEKYRCDYRYKDPYYRNSNYIGSTVSAIFWLLLICCCCCGIGGWFGFKKIRKQMKGSSHSSHEMNPPQPQQDLEYSI